MLYDQPLREVLEKQPSLFAIAILGDPAVVNSIHTPSLTLYSAETAAPLFAAEGAYRMKPYLSEHASGDGESG